MAICFSYLHLDALSQALDFRIFRRHVIVLCWMQDSKLGISEIPNRQQAEWAITNRLNYRGLSINLNSTACPFDEWAVYILDFTADWLSHLALAMYMFVVVYIDALAQASDFRIKMRQVVFLCWMQDSKLEVWDTKSPADWMATCYRYLHGSISAYSTLTIHNAIPLGY